MKNIYRSLFLLIAGATQRELARQIKYLKVENEILRSKLPKHITVTRAERTRLMKFGAKLGAAIRTLISIVHPRTFSGWLLDEKRGRRPVKRGRPRTQEQVRDLILRLAKENDWGYTRIMGELKKLGLKPPSRNTVKNILKGAGLEPGPKRGDGTWDEFLTRHAKTLWQCDFLSKPVWTLKGVKDLYVLIFLHVGSRRVWITPATDHPTAAWVQGQMRDFVEHAKGSKLPATMLFHDRDSKFTSEVDEELAQANIEVKRTAFRAPNTNAFVERFIQTIQQECLDHFMVFGEAHLNLLVREFLEHYHMERPHQGKENELLVVPKTKRRRKVKPPDTISLTDVRCEQKLGGLLKSYKWAA
jgi:putative transposase